MGTFIESFCPVLSKFQNDKSLVYDRQGLSKFQYVPSDPPNPRITKQSFEICPSRTRVKVAPYGLFYGKQFVLEMPSEENKLKGVLKKKILENGGQISYVLTRDTSFVVCAGKKISKEKLKAARRYDCPAVTSNFIEECLAKGTILQHEHFLFDHSLKLDAFQEGKISFSNELPPVTNSRSFAPVQLLPIVVSTLNDYTLTKYVLLKGVSKYSSGKYSGNYRFATIEIHVQKAEDVPDQFCVFVHEGEIDEKTNSLLSGDMRGQFANSAREALSVYCNIFHKLTGSPKFLYIFPGPLHVNIGSPAFQTIQRNLLLSVSDVDPEIQSLLSKTWNEARLFLLEYMDENELYSPEWKVREAKNVLVQLAVALTKNSGKLLERLSKEFYSILNFKPEHSKLIRTVPDLLSKFNVCNLLMSIASLLEASSSKSNGNHFMIYTGLRCQIARTHPDSSEFKELQEHLSKFQTADVGLTLHNVYSVSRNLESANFDNHLPNQKLLIHGTSPSNILSILTSGLVPLMSTLTNSIGASNVQGCSLGYGIYFSDSVNICIRHCHTSSFGTRFLFITRVALGRIYETNEPVLSLTSPPSGYDSVLGVKSSEAKSSFFSENEYVIYKETQQELCYLVEFSLESDNVSLKKHDLSQLSNSIPNVFLEEPLKLSHGIENVEAVMESSPEVCSLKRIGATSYLPDSALPLESVHIRASVVDLVARVTIFQVYKNNTETTSEVRYTFPLCGGAAVCGFEAFIGNKHVIGEVKEKEVAHKEYDEAVSEGHGAYLLDEERPDVFTARLGNLPPNTKAIIKITYIAELAVESETLKLILPASISPQQNISFLSSVNTPKEDLSFEASIEMATNIQAIFSPTHAILVKKTDTKAVIKLPSDSNWENGLIVSIRMCEMHVPRMWAEKHPDKESEVCMVSFYPEFEDVDSSPATDIVLLIDASNSMRGKSFQTALTLAALCLRSLNDKMKFNVIAFGTVTLELFPESREFNEKTKSQALVFLEKILPEMGSNNLLSPLMCCDMFSKFGITNVFLISDGYFGSEYQLFRYISKLKHLRLFTLAVSEKSNHHFMKIASQCSGGSFEEYVPTEKNKWAGKLRDQIMKTSQRSLTEIEIEWQHFDSDETEVLVVPQKIRNLFSGSFLISYGFVSNCSMATLKAKIGGREYQTVVSCRKPNVISGTLLHTLAAKAYIDDWEKGLLDDVEVLQTAKREDIKETVLAMAMDYNLVSSLTSFIAVEKRQDGEEIASEPSLEILLENSSVDILPYISFDTDDMNVHVKWHGFERDSKAYALDECMEGTINFLDSVIEQRDFDTNDINALVSEPLGLSYAMESSCLLESYARPVLQLACQMPPAKGVSDQVEEDFESCLMTNARAISKRKRRFIRSAENTRVVGKSDKLNIEMKLAKCPPKKVNGIPKSAARLGSSLTSFSSVSYCPPALNYQKPPDELDSAPAKHSQLAYQDHREFLRSAHIPAKLSNVFGSHAVSRPLRYMRCAFSAPSQELPPDQLHSAPGNCIQFESLDHAELDNRGLDIMDYFDSSDDECDIQTIVEEIGSEILKLKSAAVRTKEGKPLKLAPSLLKLLKTQGDKDSRTNDWVFDLLDGILENLGGGTPLCSMVLRVIRSEYQAVYGVDITKKSVDIMGKETCDDFPDEEMNEDPFHTIFRNRVTQFIEMMEDAGLKSMGATIYNNMCQLVSLLFVAYFYLVKYLIPSLLSDGVQLDQFENYDDLAKLLAKETGMRIPRSEANVLCACLILIDALDKKYPLIYSTLNLGNSWEKAVFEHIRKLL